MHWGHYFDLEPYKYNQIKFHILIAFLCKPLNLFQLEVNFQEVTIVVMQMAHGSWTISTKRGKAKIPHLKIPENTKKMIVFIFVFSKYFVWTIPFMCATITVIGQRGY